MKNAKVKTKILIGFGIVAVLLLMVGATGIYGLYYMKDVSDSLYYNYMTGIDAATDIEGFVLDQQGSMFNLYIERENPANVSRLIGDVEQLDADIKDAMTRYGTAFEGLENSGAQYAAAFDALYLGDYTAAMNLILEYAENEQHELLFEELISVEELFNELASDVGLVVSSADKDADSFNTAANKTADMLTWIIIGISAVAVIGSVGIGLYNASIIAKPLSELTAQAKEVSVGNVDIHIDLDRGDEIGALAGTFNSMTDAIRKQSEFIDVVASGDYRSEIPVRSEKDAMNKSLNKMVASNNEMIAKVRMSSEQVSSASSQIAQAAQTLASGSTEQAASVDEFTSTLNDVMTQTNRNAEVSQQALDAVNEAVGYMEESNILMSELLGAMNSIDESSQSITRVIKTIEDIAFQTNILALNAAVEAARAGQHGKGFAVVAEEVRSLASGSSVAAKETAELIESSAIRVKEGSELVEKTNVCMQNVAESASKVQDAINLIATASSNQAVAISELHQGIEQISQVVQANSATSEQTAASSEEMSSQAAMLDEIVAEFKLSDKYDKRLGTSYANAPLPRAATSYEPVAQDYDNFSNSDFGKY